ncbi:MAG: metallophosphoesterase [Labilithrix sp.]|nr:metallophosphoesterase [Labilithrix sp.]MCW5812046.1 metallophosphoesterase [Labilithrix sp.]
MLGRSLLACAALSALLVACGSDGSDGGSATDPSAPAMSADEVADGELSPAEIAKKLEEKPWEVVSNKGETYVPNVFYADASQNEQIMPYAIGGHVMIDRLIYPTLGNPNLYVKKDATEEFVSVLRIEDAALDAIGGLEAEALAGSSLKRVTLPNDAKTGIAFFLVKRAGREQAESKVAISSGTGTDAIRVYPNDVLMNAEPADMPAVLKKRHTLRFVFKQGAMQRVPAGLYDLRMEVRKDNKLVTVGSQPVYEYQYNAVRVFDDAEDEHSVINITDTQVSVGDLYNNKTKDKLDELVYFLNTTNDPAVLNASFITFNGDLHNGGSPGTLRQRPVATTYQNEAKAIVDLLKYLPIPIFLTTGNHDGYVATGHVPSAVKAVDTLVIESLKEVIKDNAPNPWPNFDQSAFESYLAKTAASDKLGGEHRDIFTGGFARNAKAEAEGFAGWKEVPRADRNYILYDGFYQWQKTYGPLFYSHKFGKSAYVSLNSYELRQHRRSGWGMYTVNYGGSMNDVQMDWLDRELLRAKQDNSDVIILAHHDPRGGHKGKDFGYYFEQLEYRSVFQSAVNYLVGKVWNPLVCTLPDWALSTEQTESCAHDGLQEWMRPDAEFDCDWDQRGADFTCDPAKGEPFSSGVELLKRLASSPQVRTVLLGHTHYNSLEVIQEGDELIPGKFPVDAASTQKFATLEVLNPVRGYSQAQTTNGASEDYDNHAVPMNPIADSVKSFGKQYDKSVAGWSRHTASGKLGPRELVFFRLVSASDLANQTYSGGKSSMGFTVLTLETKSDKRGVTLPQINRAKFFANIGQSRFDVVGEIEINRAEAIGAHDPKNPVEKLFDW